MATNQKTERDPERQIFCIIDGAGRVISKHETRALAEQALSTKKGHEIIYCPGTTRIGDHYRDFPYYFGG